MDLCEELEIWLAQARRGAARTRHLRRAAGPIQLDPAAVDPCRRNKVLVASGQTYRELHVESVPPEHRRTATVCSVHLERDVARAALLQSEFGAWLLGATRINCYRSPGGVGTPLHFDAMSSMVVQSRGTKHWWVADAPGLPLPTRNCVPAPGADSVMHEGRLLAVPSPDAMRRLVLAPGDVLLLPAGAWHCTEAGTDSASFTFAFTRLGADPRRDAAPMSLSA